MKVVADLDKAPPAPSTRVRIRGEEWAVRKCLPLQTGGHALHVVGLSELVRYHEAIFLTPLDRDIEPLRPEDTRLVPDSSPNHRQTLLYLETLLRRTPPSSDRVTVGHRGALDLMPFQLVPAQRCLGSLRPRILIADGTGLGKTTELGIILSELVKRGRGRRILVVAIKSMLAQLQRELWARFTLPLVRLDSEGLARVQARIPSNRNPFSYYDRCIVSVDTLKNSGLYRDYLRQIRWDVIVIDECHNVANQRSQRGELARLLAAQCDALVMTSATPHNGRAESFANLMRMLDPTSVADPRTLVKEHVQHLFVRRFKKDVEREAADQLRDRKIATCDVEATGAEEAALAALHRLDLHTLGRKQHRRDLLIRWTLVKSFLSSPEAGLESLDERIKKTEEALRPTAEGPHPQAAVLRADLVHLQEARARVAAVRDAGGGKLGRLVKELRAIGLDNTPSSPRVLIFSERIRTLEILHEALAREFRLRDGQIATYTAAGILDVVEGQRSRGEAEQRRIIEEFGQADKPLRLLLCSDAASEGVNLHHQCHHLFHFDVPWSIIRLTQRNGRIDRFGQRQTTQIRYLVTRTGEDTADQRIVERLIEKEREVERQLGDPGALLGLYDPITEEEFLTRGIAEGKSLEALLPDRPLDPQAAAAALGAEGVTPIAEERAPLAEPATDLLALFKEIEEAETPTPKLEDLVAEPKTLFPGDYELLVAALRHLENERVTGPGRLRWEHNDREKAVEVWAPEPFQRYREPFLPSEAIPAPEQPYRLVAGRQVVAEKLRAAIDEEGRWPDWHLLWEQHPVVEWLLDALASAYARGEAPALLVPALGQGRAIFLLQAILYNHEAEAVDARWLGLETAGEVIAREPLSLDQVIERTGLRRLVNTGKPVKRMAALQRLVPAVVKQASQRVKGERQERVKEALVGRARAETRRVHEWAKKSRAFIESRTDSWRQRNAKIPRPVQERLTRDLEHVEHVERSHQEFLRCLQAFGEPSVRLGAVFSGE